MAVLKPPGPRFQTERSARGAKITFAPRRNGPMLLFNGAWLGAWAFGEFTVLRQLLGGDFANAGTVAFLAFWLIAWTVGGALILRTWLSNLVGREVVEVGGGSLKLCKKLGPFSRSASSTSSTSGICASPPHLRRPGPDVLGRFTPRLERSPLTTAVAPSGLGVSWMTPRPPRS